MAPSTPRSSCSHEFGTPLTHVDDVEDSMAQSGEDSESQEDHLDNDDSTLDSAANPSPPRSVELSPKESISRLLQDKEKEWAAVAEKKGPLNLLDLPVDILKEIIHHLPHTNDLTSLALTHSALHALTIPQIYARFDIVWPDETSNAETRSGVDALTYGLATLVMAQELFEDAFHQRPPSKYASQYMNSRHAGSSSRHGSYPIVKRRRGNYYAQYTKKFSLGNGPPEFVQEYLITKEGGKMLGTLVAIAIARMRNLETFVWDMPTGVLRDIWMALSSLADDDSRECPLERLWIRWHDNRPEVARVTVPPPPAMGLGNVPPPPPNPGNPSSNTVPQTIVIIDPANVDRLQAIDRVEHPTFSVIPPLKSLSVLDIDELPYLDEMSVLIARSQKKLRELRVGIARHAQHFGWVTAWEGDGIQQVDYATTDTAACSISDKRLGGVLGILVGRVYNMRRNSVTVTRALTTQFAERTAPEPSKPATAPIPAPTPTPAVATTPVPTVPAAGTERESDNTPPHEGEPQPDAAPAQDPAPAKDEAPIDDNAEAEPTPAAVQTPTQTVAPTVAPTVAQTAPQTAAQTAAPTEDKSEIDLSNLHISEPVQEKARPTLPTEKSRTLDLARDPDRTEEFLTRRFGPALCDKLRLETLELERVPLSVSIMLKAFDWSALTTLTLLHCPNHEALWKSLRRTFSPRPPHHAVAGNAKSAKASVRLEYRLCLKKIHTNAVSPSLISFLKETLAPNSLEVLFLQEGRGYSSTVTIDQIYKGPIRRHRASLKKLMIDSSERGPDGTPTMGIKWRRWMVNRDILQFITSGRMKSLRELAVTIDYKDWHYFLQHLPFIPHVRSLYIPHIADHAHGNNIDPRELAMQILDIVHLRPEVEICYMGLANKCFEILENRPHSHDRGSTSANGADGAGGGGAGGQNTNQGYVVVDISEDEEGESEDDDEEDVEGDEEDGDAEEADATESEDEAFGDDDDDTEDESDVRGSDDGRPRLRLREILFYDDKVAIFRARHGRL